MTKAEARETARERAGREGIVYAVVRYKSRFVAMPLGRAIQQEFYIQERVDPCMSNKKKHTVTVVDDDIVRAI
jgi:glutamine phosphoribosylpyrophosphate amidotransferase